MTINGIGAIGKEKQKQQNPINFAPKDNQKRRLAEEFSASLTGIQNKVNYVKNGGNIFQQSKDTAATSM